MRERVTMGGPGKVTARRSFGSLKSAGGIVACILLIPGLAAAQQQPPATLTVQEAIDLARKNNPLYRQTVNDAGDADWSVREAYANFIPTLQIQNGFGYQAAGNARVGGISASDLGLASQRPAIYSSSYGISGGMQLSGATFFGAAQAKANQKATDARIQAAAFDLSSNVTAQYLAALRARDGVAIAQTALDVANESFRLVDAQNRVGASTRLDVASAEVTRGRAEVALIQAKNLYDTEKLRLMQQIGVELNRDVDLTSTFEVFEPQWTVEELTTRALREHPQVVAARRNESAANAATRARWSQYLPSLSLNATLLSGYVSKQGNDAYVLASAKAKAQSSVDNCESSNLLNAHLVTPLPGYPRDCSTFAYTDAQGNSALAANNLFPFNYTKSPASVSLFISLPIFDGFTRERQLDQAKAAAEDARYARRAEELNRSTMVAQNLLALNAAYQSVQIEEKNAATAAEQLHLAQEKYRLGAGNVIELTQAQDTKAKADQSRLGAIYQFHQSLAALEAAVGEPLRNTRQGDDDAPAREK